MLCKPMRGALLGLVCLAATGCWRAQPNEAVVYTALDAEYSRPVLDDFAKQSALLPLPKFDVESTKSVGLASAIIAEANRPRCDVFWNNEILNTIRLANQGLLEPYHSPAALDFPAAFRDPHRRWSGFAARARILIVNTQQVSEAERPTSVRDMLDAKWRGKIGIAKPLFGTTATHVACLFAVLGPDEAKDLLLKLKANDVQVLSGN